MTLMEAVGRVSPKACRLIARKNRGRLPMSCADIAALSGLSKSRVADISKMESWKGIPIDTVEAFARACGVNHLKAEAQLDFIRRRPLNHLKRGTRTQRLYLGNLLAS